MPFGVTFWYHNQKSTSSRFRVLSGSCLTSGGHAASFINQVCIMLVNSFTISDGITNGAGLEAWAWCFLMCSSGVWSLLFLALAISRASLNSGLSREDVCFHVFLPAWFFPSSLGNTPVTEMEGSPFPHGRVILMAGGKAWPFFLFWLDLLEVASDSESEKLNELPQSIRVLLSCFCRTASSFWRPVSLASSSVIHKLACANFLSTFWWWSHSVEAFSSTSLTLSVKLLWWSLSYLTFLLDSEDTSSSIWKTMFGQVILKAF